MAAEARKAERGATAGKEPFLWKASFARGILKAVFQGNQRCFSAL